MRIFLSLLFIVTLAACKPDHREFFQGSWSRNSLTGEEIFFPYDLTVSGDSILLTDRYIFTHKASFEVNSDSIKIRFADGFEKSFFFNVLNDSSFVFDKNTFFRVSSDWMPHPMPMSLLDVETGHRLTEQNAVASFFGLLKIGDSLKVRLNDSYADLKYLREFLLPHEGEGPRAVYIYIGKNVSLIDLAQAYYFVDRSMITETHLITKNIGFDFYDVRDNIDIGLVLLAEIMQSQNAPPNPPIQHVLSEPILIYSKEDFGKLKLLDTQKKYKLVVSSALSLTNYIELLVLVENLTNITTQIEKLSSVN